MHTHVQLGVVRSTVDPVLILKTKMLVSATGLNSNVLPVSEKSTPNGLLAGSVT
jgi:ribulose 1,5-bisphosphate synthetase/thiazole synthase